MNMMLSIPKNNLTMYFECSIIKGLLHNGESNEVNKRHY
jgi:hypothetical protein